MQEAAASGTLVLCLIYWQLVGDRDVRSSADLDQ